MTTITPTPLDQIWVVFSGQTDMRWLRWLKPGYRHCFAILKGDTHWIMLDSMLHRMDMTVTHLTPDFDLPSWLRTRGYVVVAAPRRDVPARMAGLWPFTCVEAMKRLIGIQDWRIFTPWQLYQALTRKAPKPTAKPQLQTQGAAYGQIILPA